MISRRAFIGRVLGVAAVTPFVRYLVPLFESNQPLKPGLQMISIKDIVVDPSLSCRLYPHDAEHMRALMDSINDMGLMNPIVIDTNRLLLAGFARIEACRRLGHEAIMCQVFVADPDATAWHRIIDNKVRHQFPLAAAGIGLLAAPLRAEAEEDEDDLDDLDDDMDDFPEDDDEEEEDEEEDEDDEDEDEDEDDEE